MQYNTRKHNKKYILNIKNYFWIFYTGNIYIWELTSQYGGVKMNYIKEYEINVGILVIFETLKSLESSYYSYLPQKLKS